MGRRAMTRLTDYTTYADAHRHFSPAALWALFAGDRESLNIAHECVDRHADSGRIAVRVAHADGRDETLSFRELSEWSARFAHWLAAPGGSWRRRCVPPIARSSCSWSPRSTAPGSGRATASSARPRPRGGTGSGTVRWPRWHSV